METLNQHYFARQRVQNHAARTAAVPAAARSRAYRVFLRAHLEAGYHTPLEHLREDITAAVPALETLSYQSHVVPLAQTLQGRLEQDLGVRVRSIDVEVQYQP
ncbi:hypothetical protein E4656_07600 [Natronospirillum operosum]|uniref:Uncharacterized protein n=1 Tax=Natronospirillum operosum TaxID=2759953 RepID=A0A4Z0W7K1_9GAMM|nr:hypothetical protein [Natronospirillum operosum]TGG94034.1 hypothetical protein E4656_07600 [Natronospirillum operosum]